MHDFLQQILEDKKKEIELRRQKIPLESLRQLCPAASPCRSLEKVLAKPGPAGVNIIAEIKRASPSRGPICPEADAVRVARKYQQGGAAAISVLTDAKYFRGSLEDLRRVKQAVALPVMRKDFILDQYQVFEARAAGADAVLLIARIMPSAKLTALLDLVRKLEMEALVEIHRVADLEVVTAMDVSLVAINNRDLETFKTDPDTAPRLVSRLKSWQVAVAASAIAGAADIRRSREAGIHNFLVGESLMRAPDCLQHLKELLHGWKKSTFLSPG